MQSVRFAAKFEFLDEIREFVGGIARQGGFSDKDVYNIQLATDEAASNMIEHSYENIPDGVIDLSCGMEGGADGDQIRIVLIDYGEPFDPSAIPLPDLKADLSDRKIGGLGIFLMRKLMDEVHYEPKPDKSNVLTMIKRKR
jgi:anti-sigma regulatory factor (Ser/Thr protein kinase)